MLQSVTNKRVIAHKESDRADRDTIAKCPFAAIRVPDLEDVVLTLRDPRDIVTSRSHGKHLGKYVIGWKRGEGRAPYGLVTNWRAMRPYLETAHLVSYTRLLSEPDAVQDELGEAFGLEFDRKFSDWPEGYEVEDYWQRTGLGPVRPIHKPRSWRDDPQDVERVAEMSKYPEFLECVETITRLDGLQGNWLERRASCMG